VVNFASSELKCHVNHLGIKLSLLCENRRKQRSSFARTKKMSPYVFFKFITSPSYMDKVWNGILIECFTSGATSKHECMNFFTLYIYHLHYLIRLNYWLDSYASCTLPIYE
jgi:hypothetical protein